MALSYFILKTFQKILWILSAAWRSGWQSRFRLVEPLLSQVKFSFKQTSQKNLKILDFRQFTNSNWLRNISKLLSTSNTLWTRERLFYLWILIWLVFGPKPEVLPGLLRETNESLLNHSLLNLIPILILFIKNYAPQRTLRVIPKIKNPESSGPRKIFFWDHHWYLDQRMPPTNFYFWSHIFEGV